MEEKVLMRLADRPRHVFQCMGCMSLWGFEADGPYENGWDFCPHCGKPISRENYREEV